MGYATQQQKLDYLFKKIGFTKSKTGVAEDQTTGFSGDTKKAGPNESIASPLVIPSTGVYADSQSIPSTPPTSSTSVVGIHTVGNPFRMTVDTSVANERAFVARETWGQPVSAIKGDWIDTQFGTDYLVKVHLGDPSTVSPGAAYTYLSAAGTSGKDDIWFFDYSSGVLNFNGADLDGQLAGVTTSNVYIVGYRYLGTKGIQPPSGIGTFNDLYVSGVSTFVGVGTFNSHLYVGGNLEVKGTTKFEGGTLTLGDSASDNVVFGADVDSDIIPDDDSTYDLGSTGQRWKKLWVDEISIGGTFSVGQDIETRHLLVTGISTFQGDSTFEGATSGRNVVWDKSENSLEFADNAKAVFGGSESLEIFHDSSDSYIKDVGTGSLNLTSNGRGFLFTKGGSEQIANLLTDSAVELFWDNSKKFSTSGLGVTITDQLDVNNINVSAGGTFGAFVDINSDLDVDGKTDLDDLSVAGVTTFSDDVNLQGVNAGVTSAYWDKSANEFKFIDNTKLSFGTGSDGSIKHTGSNFQIQETTGNIQITNYANDKDVVISTDNGSGGTTNYIKANGSSGQVELNHYGSSRLKTTGIGITITGVGNTAYIEGPDELWIDPHPYGVGTTSGIVRIRGDLYVDGKEFYVDSTTIELADHRVGIATTVGTNNLLDGGGIGIGSANILKTLVWNNSSSSLKSSENFDLLDNKVYKINGTTVLSKDSLGIGITNIHGVIEQLVTKNLRVTGVSTFTGAVDANNRVDIALDLDVDGKTDLDDLSVSGVSTFSALVDINSDLDVDGQTNVDDLNIVGVTTAAGHVLPSVDNTYDLGSNSKQWRNVYVSNLVVAPGGPGFAGSNLTVNNLSVLGISTFAGNIDVNSDLDVDGKTDLDDLSVAGVSTFSSNIDANANLDVDGQTDLDVLNVAETATFSAFVDINSDLDVDGKTDLDDLSVAGVSTFTSAIDANGGADISGGVGLNVVGHTELDEVNVSGITTTTQLQVGTVGQTLVGINTILDEDNMASDSATALVTQQSVKAYVDSQVTAQDLDFQADSGGALSIDLDSETLGIIGTSNEIETSGSGNNVTIGLPDNVTIANKLTVTGDLDVDGKTDLDDLSVAGVSTFSAFVDVNSDLDVDGKTDLDDLSVSGVSTFTALVDLNSDIDVDGQTTLDDLNVSGISTFAGIATFTSSDVYIDNNLYVGGIQINPGTGITTPSLDIDEYIRHNGDSNTKFGFPATDTFNITTAGTERVRINHVGHTTASGTLNSQTDVQINGTSVLTTAENDAIALAIALG